MTHYYLENASIADYKLIRKLGSGKFSEIWLVRNKNGLSFSLKLFFVNSDFNDSILEYIESELQNYTQLLHSNFIKIVESGVYNGRPFLVMPLYKYNLKEQMENHTVNWSENLLAKLICDVTNGLKYLHSKAIIHRSIDPYNILIAETANAHFIVSDFGLDLSDMPFLNKMISRSYNQYDLTKEIYKAAEYKSGKKDTQSDVYALGLILYQFYIGKLDLHHSDGIFKNQIERLNNAKSPYSLEFKELILKCIDPNPQQRITTTQLNQSASAFMAKSHWGNLNSNQDHQAGSPIALNEQSKKGKMPVSASALKATRMLPREKSDADVRKSNYLRKGLKAGIILFSFLLMSNLLYLGLFQWGNVKALSFSTSVLKPVLLFSNRQHSAFISNMTQPFKVIKIAGNNLALVQSQEGLWGIIDSKGETVLDCQMSALSDFKLDGRDIDFAIFEKGPYCGFVTQSGEITSELFESCQLINPNTGMTSKVNKYGTRIDKPIILHDYFKN